MKTIQINRWWRKYGGCDTGQALIETAFAAALFVPLLLGAVELARLTYAAIEVSNAAKAAVQYGSQTSATATDTIGITNAAKGEAANLTSLTVTSVARTCVCSDGSTSTCANTDCANSHIEETLIVNTQATVTPFAHVPGLPTTFTLKGRAAQRVLQ